MTHNRLRLWRLVFSFFVYAQAGMSDGSLGAQLESIQSHYNLTFSVVSLIFLANAAGWMVASFLNIYLLHHLNLWKTLVVASIINIVGSVIIIPSPPFPLFVVALFLIGIGACIFDASFAAYTAHFDDGPAMSLLFAAFGFGALIAPLVVFSMLDNNIPWNSYYYVPLGISVLNVPLLWAVFRNYHSPEEQDATAGALQRLLRVIRNPAVLAGGLLTALSMASGEILTSWMVSFMTEIRQGNNAAMRFVLSGYWVGLVLGRLSLAYTTYRIGPRVALIVYGILAASLLAVMQFVKSIPANAVAAGLTGFFQAPSTPMIISLSSKGVPSSLVGPAISVLTAFGLVGSAIGPLCVGFVNASGGLKYLPAITMGAIGVTLVVWHLSPSAPWRIRIGADANETQDMKALESDAPQPPERIHIAESLRDKSIAIQPCGLELSYR